MGVGSVEGCDDQESVCSSTEREGDAFPKAFDRELVTPTNLQKAQSDANENAAGECNVNKSIDNDTKETAETVNSTTKTYDDGDVKSDLGREFREMRTLEERRRSMLDHHWAVPSKERYEK